MAHLQCRSWLVRKLMLLHVLVYGKTYNLCCLTQVDWQLLTIIDNHDSGYLGMAV